LATVGIPNNSILFHTRDLAFQSSIECIMLTVSMIAINYIIFHLTFWMPFKLSSSLLLSADQGRLQSIRRPVRNYCGAPSPCIYRILVHMVNPQ
jgi:hypothetical protein